VEYTAKALSIDISTASRNLKRGYFWQIELTAVVMEGVIRRTFQSLHSAGPFSDFAKLPWKLAGIAQWKLARLVWLRKHHHRRR
jgi:hypothetical protein